ncbi:hypothetical protein RIF29_21932 [Crotalaria pallida]|uniref:Uncharacterized protein n=1 Tax=Crotalaria pallida TaxID=3830 RepID=A0AAN9I8X5_CROPI
MTMSKSKVTVHSTLTVVSSEPIIDSGKSHPLTVLDQAMGLRTLSMIYYYKDLGNLLGSFELDPLRESLCKVLTLYPNMTGRLAKGQDGNWEIRYNDAGVRVIMTNVDATLHEWLTSENESNNEALLIAWEDMPLDDPKTWSPFRIQINIFKGGDVAIGLSCSHMVADPTSLASFFKSWTETQRHLPITNPPFFTTPTPQLNANSSPSHYATTTTTATLSSSSTQTKKRVTATFKFSNSVIKKCVSQVHNICPNATPFDFLSALFWTRVTHLKPHKKNQDQTHSLSICTDFRRLMKTPLPTGYFGNALHFSMLSVKDMDSVGLEGITSLVHKHLEVAELENEGNFGGVQSLMYGCELTCVCMEHMMVSDSSGNNDADDESLMYSAVFSKNEKPVHVSCHVGNMNENNGEGLIMVMPSLEGGHARNVMVTLPEEELAELIKDEAILQLEPTIMLASCW